MACEEHNNVITFTAVSLSFLRFRLRLAQLFKKFPLNPDDLAIPCFAIQDQVFHLTFVLVFQSNIVLDNPDLDTNFSR